VHDIAYDHYGRRLAVCTSSLRISVYSAPVTQGEEVDSTAEWIETARMDRAHGAPIWRLCWGHPEHGEPLASCSEDRTVAVWSDKSCVGVERRSLRTDGGSTTAGSISVEAASGAGRTIPILTKRRTLQGEGPIVDVRFAPGPMGLKIAAVTANGDARVFECNDALRLVDWGSEDLESNARPAASTMQAAGNTTATADTEKPPAPVLSSALDWMPVPFGGELAGDERPATLAVAGRGARLAIWTRSMKNRRWESFASVEEAHPASGGGVKDVAWCPNLCRAFEIVATCGEGASLWRVDIAATDKSGRPATDRRQDGGERIKLQHIKTLVNPWDKVGLVWRCSWNVCGTAIALGREGCEVSVWRSDASLDWHQEADIDLTPCS